MKLLGRLSIMLLLSAAFAQSSLGGEIHIGRTDPPPDPPPVTQPGDIHIPGEIQLLGEIHIGGGTQGSGAADVAMNLLQELLLVF